MIWYNNLNKVTVFLLFTACIMFLKEKMFILTRDKVVAFNSHNIFSLSLFPYLMNNK
jgi:hypothetical protein